MKAYTVGYIMNDLFPCDKGFYRDVKYVSFLAKNKKDAYDKAVYEIIPESEAYSPRRVWVRSVTYNNGNVKYFSEV